MGDAAPTVLDRSGQGNHATVYGAVQAAGRVGGAYQFVDGTCVTAPNSASLQMVGGTALTMMAWVRYAGGCTTGTHGIVVNKESTYEMGPLCDALLPQFDEAIQLSDGAWAWVGAQVLTLDTWQLVATTWDGTTERVYVDGVETATFAHAGVFAGRDTGLGIGCRGVAPDGTMALASAYFIGLIDEVTIYSRALSVGEIAAYMSATQ
jgi:hypothetical protein